MRPLALALVLALEAPPAVGAESPVARPQANQAGPTHLLPARRSPVACGPLAASAAAVLEDVAVTWRLDPGQAARLQALVIGDEALRHPDLATLALAVSFEQDLPLEEVTAARREALLDALMGPAIPQSECLTAQAVTRLRARLLSVCCAELHATRATIERWAQHPARPYLLLAERGGPPIPGTCRRVLRRELGDPAEMELQTPSPADEVAPPGQGSAILPPPG